MKHFILKAAISVSALLAAGQASAADFILTNGDLPNPNVHFYSTASSSTDVAATLGNSHGAGAFSDSYYFAVPFVAALGNGAATSNNRINLNFDQVAGLSITEFVSTPALQSAMLNAFSTGLGYAAALSDLQSYVTSNPGLGTLLQLGAYAESGNGSSMTLSDVPLNATSFYVITVSGTSTATTGVYSGNLSASAVPEPATWAMLLAGFGAVGFAMRRRGNQNVKVSFA